MALPEASEFAEYGPVVRLEQVCSNRMFTVIPTFFHAVSDRIPAFAGMTVVLLPN